ncbi:hypothetical protein, partial [Enterococcus faecium]|uniref:hypothetical protein n=1 Tax=Enterococcus faecium TaxID=1352 RepID=UPI003DA010EC
MVDAMISPDILFTWPLARVFAVFFLDAVKPVVEEIDASTPEGLLRVVNMRRAKKNLPPLTELPKREK